ncbi:hypothetical protein EJB05_39300, partial [Eragrostis curvula]
RPPRRRRSHSRAGRSSSRATRPSDGRRGQQGLAGHGRLDVGARAGKQVQGAAGVQEAGAAHQASEFKAPQRASFFGASLGIPFRLGTGYLRYLMERVPSMSEVVVDSRDIADQASRSSKKRSKVWDYVETELVDGKEKAICRFCNIHLSNVPGQGISHLNRH